MRFLAWRILGWILKEASMAAAACLFQKDGISSSAGTVQTPISPSSPAQASLGHLCRVPSFQGYSFPGHSHAEASSHVDQVVQGAIWGGGRPFKLAPTAWPQGPGAGNKGGSKTRHDGALSGEWDGAKSMVGGGDTGYRHFPQTSPQHRSK